MANVWAERSAVGGLHRQAEYHFGLVPWLIAHKFDGSKQRTYPGRPRVEADAEALVLRLARENTGCGYDRIVGTLANLGHSDQTVGNILRRHDIVHAPKRKQTKLGKISFAGTRRYWWAPTSSRWPC